MGEEAFYYYHNGDYYYNDDDDTAPWVIFEFWKFHVALEMSEGTNKSEIFLQFLAKNRQNENSSNVIKRSNG